MSRFPYVVVAAVALGALGAVTTTLSQDESASSRIAFVNVGRVFEDYRKRETIEQRLDAAADSLQDRFKSAVSEMNADREKLNTLNPGSPESRALERDLAARAFLLKHNREAATRTLRLNARRQKALLYKEICEEVAAYGEDQGLGAIFLWVPLGDDLYKLADLDILTSTRTVLWRDERLDVTAEVVQALNAALPPAPPAVDPEDGGEDGGR